METVHLSRGSDAEGAAPSAHVYALEKKDKEQQPNGAADMNPQTKAIPALKKKQSNFWKRNMPTR